MHAEFQLMSLTYKVLTSTLHVLKGDPFSTCSSSVVTITQSSSYILLCLFQYVSCCFIITHSIVKTSQIALLNGFWFQFFSLRFCKYVTL